MKLPSVTSAPCSERAIVSRRLLRCAFACLLVCIGLLGCKDTPKGPKISQWTKNTYTRVSEADVRGADRRARQVTDEPVAKGADNVADPKPSLSIVIDDVGLRRNVIDPFLAVRGLRGVLTWALLPNAPHAVSLGRELTSLNEDLILHMPMEPNNPGNIAPHLGSYLRQMHTPSQIRDAVIDAFNTFPQDIRSRFVGLNNHQGSSLTASAPHMLAIAEVAKARGVFVLDSKTSKASLLAEVAISSGVPARSRDVFLDNIKSPEAIQEQLNLAADLAIKSGSAVAIGHPYPETALALASWLQTSEQGVKLVALRTLIQPVPAKPLDSRE